MNNRIGIALISLFCLWFSTGAEAIDSAGTDFDPLDYYTFRQDTRKCAYPRCGGIFVKAVNKKSTRCTDGAARKECYIAEIDNPRNINLGTAGLLHGQVKKKRFQGAGNLGKFVLQAAYSPVTDITPEKDDIFVGLENNGIVCITTPCFSYDEYLLNSNKLRPLSNVDLASLGVIESLLANLYQALSSEVLIASGINMQVSEATGTGLSFIAKQAYLPIPGSQ